MLNGAELVVGYDEVEAEVREVLQVVGRGQVNSVAYDTAWVARLAPMFPGGAFDGALPWLRRFQHGDGSWGGEVFHSHDRFICTLAAAIALRIVGNGRDDEVRIRQAEKFLWREHTRIRHDAWDTIGFPVLAATLVEEARLLGISTPRHAYCDSTAILEKLSILQDSPKLWRKYTMSFSMEALRACFPDNPDFLEENGSVGTSPAATAAVLLRSKSVSSAAVDYLHSVMQPDGGAPNVAPIDTFEIAWSLNYLRLAGVISPDQPEVRQVLDKLSMLWSRRSGLGFSSYYSVLDLDDTAACYAVLRWGGYPVSADSFAAFEEDDHFRCFPGELNPSLSANVRLISALRMNPTHPCYDQWMTKCLGMLRRCEENGDFWFDKWHASPYYLVAITVEALSGVADDLVKPRIEWLKSTQREDGGWGYYGWSTLEETAYALLALLLWDEHYGGVAEEIIEAGGQFLSENYHKSHLTPLWIGKCLYTPPNVVRAAILTSLHKYLMWRE